MEFYGNLKNQLSRRADIEKNRTETAMADTDIDDSDVDLFEMSLQQRNAKYAFHEQVRARHMLLKAAIDGAQS
ncbi:MAG: hypothetical protein WBB95_03570 [Pseudomonas sp.]|uniref:hypothetical protein n=1 Tax=Pseudomonas sp. TaxID=306 RepID=UPI003C74F287